MGSDTSHVDAEPTNALDLVDDPNLLLGLFQSWALFDMKLNVGG